MVRRIAAALLNSFFLTLFARLGAGREVELCPRLAISAVGLVDSSPGVVTLLADGWAELTLFGSFSTWKVLGLLLRNTLQSCKQKEHSQP